MTDENVFPTSAPSESPLDAGVVKVEIVEQAGDWFWRAYDEEDNMVNNSDPLESEAAAEKAAEKAYPNVERG